MKKIYTTIIMLYATLTLMAQGKNHNFEAQRQLETFSAIYQQLDMMYVDSLNPKETIGTGISRMLRSLDPYTEYYPADEVKNLRSMLTGKYAGIGAVIKYNMVLDRVVIDEPYEGMPAAEAGLKKGDIIISIDDTLMAGKSTQYVSEHLRGDAGSTFLLKVLRESPESRARVGEKGYKPQGKTLKFKITRRAIVIPPIPYYGMLGDSIGYLTLTSFTEDCARDVRRAIVDLRQQGMKGLVFDIRGNGGGSLSEAVDIVGMFVGKGETLVTTKGKLKRANHEYKTKHEPIDTVMPVVVLVNGNSASASEITAGSLQDLDRAVIMGSRTFGKGLVQQPVDLPHGGSLKLTVSKYHIPSGRCIQAINYKHSGGGYKEHIPDSLTKEFRTRGGRTVRDGGGIKPDVELKRDTLPNIIVYLQQGGMDSTEVLHYYVLDYIASHPTIASPREFQLSDSEFEDFKARAIKAGFKYDRESQRLLKDLEEVARMEGYYDSALPEFEALKAKLTHNLTMEIDRNKREIKMLIEDAILSAYYFQAGSSEHQVVNDRQVAEAKALLLDSARYHQLLTPQKPE